MMMLEFLDQTSRSRNSIQWLSSKVMHVLRGIEFHEVR
jgi:hypothetical protein